MRNSFSLGKLFGIEIRADFSWLIGLVLLVWLLSAHYFPMTYPGWTPGAVFSAAVATAILFFLSVLAHELGHSLVSARLGMPVPRITLFIFGGLAQLSGEPKRPRDEFLISAAGPLVSLLLALGFSALSWAGPDRVGIPLAAFGKWLGLVNLGLGLFNLLPGLPLDGGRILRALVWSRTNSFRKATIVAGWTGRILAFGLIGWGIYLVFQGNWADGLWMAFIGWFIEQAAAQSMARVALEDMLVGHTAREAMMTDCPRVSPAMTLQKLVDDVVLHSGRRCFPVVGGERITGLITLNEVTAIPRDQWVGTSVGTAMIPFKDLKSVSPNTDLFEVFQQMAEANLNQLPVVENGQFVGMVGRDGVIAFLQARAKLGV